MKQLSDTEAKKYGLRTVHHEMDNGELRFRLVSDSGSSYILTKSTENNGWQKSHVHYQKQEFYLVEKGTVYIALLIDNEVQIKKLCENDSMLIPLGVPHNVRMSDNALLHTIKYGTTDEDWNGCEELDQLLGNLENVFSENPRYTAAYNEYMEIHKNGYGKNSTPEELATFEKFFGRDFLNGIMKDGNEREELIRGERLVIRKARIADADFMQSVESDPDNAPWVANWPLGWRIAKLGSEDFLQTVIEKIDGTPIGLLIFRGMRTVGEKLELKRIALIEKGKGYGKEALYLAQKLAFEVLKTPYLYLGTKENNLRAQSIYKATGFTPDMPDPCTSFHITAEDYMGRKTDLKQE